MKAPRITITSLFPKGDAKNYIGYEAPCKEYPKGKPHNIQTLVNVPYTPLAKYFGKGPTISHPYRLITRGDFTYSRNAEKEVYTPETEHFILDLTPYSDTFDREEKMMALGYE